MREKAPLIALLCAGVACVSLAGAQAPPASGLDPSTFDRSIRPQDDFFRYVNGAWLAKTEMPPDRVTYNASVELTERIQTDLRALIEEYAARPNRKKGSTAQQIADLYASMLDEARSESLGIAPLQPELARIDAITTTTQLAAEAGLLSSIGFGGPFPGTAAIDVRDLQPVVNVRQGGVLLPDREYYLSDAPRFVDLREKYLAYLTRIFTLTNRPNAAADAKAVIALETELAKAQWTLMESRDASKTSNRIPMWELPERMPGFDWKAWAKPQGISFNGFIIIAQPSFFRSFAALVPVTPIETWRAWLAARYITAAAAWSNQALTMERFDFFGKILTGQEEPIIRWKRGVNLVSFYLGDAIGRTYVERHFPPDSKVRVQRIVKNVLEAYRTAINDADWMAGPTKSEARVKLWNLKSQIGYPEKWRDYARLRIEPDDLLGNVQRAQQWDNEFKLQTLKRGQLDGLWTMTPQTLNAYYNLASNEIVFPAAILQPPYFDPDADEAVNYGAIGAVIGHEIGHGFDGRGRSYDGNGALRDWWTTRDEEQFTQRAALLVAQYNAYAPLDDVHVNGAITFEENLADLGGLSIALRAYKLSLGGKPAPVIDGLTGEQRFFIGWARIWRAKTRPEYLRQTIRSAPHAPPEFRANGVVSNIPAFYEAFSVKPGDKLYRNPVLRVRIW